MKHSYHLEVFSSKWLKLFEGRLQFLQGYMDAKKDYAPRLAHRIMRSDGRVIEGFEAHDEVSVGMIAGWPTAGQYEAAAQRALDQAKVIREREARRPR